MTLRGKVDATTGMLFNLSDLKKYLEKVAQQIDHKNIDKDIPFFLNHPSTSENVAIFVWEALKEKFQKPELLYEVKIVETEQNKAYYRGELSVWKDYTVAKS